MKNLCNHTPTHTHTHTHTHTKYMKFLQTFLYNIKISHLYLGPWLLTFPYPRYTRITNSSGHTNQLEFEDDRCRKST